MSTPNPVPQIDYKPPGLINNAINPEAAATTVQGFDPAKVTLDPAADTVAGRVDQIIKADSPLMQTAATRAKQMMNARGLLNTTMAGQAGEQAVIETALPMAQQDAAASLQTKQFNTGNENQAMQFNAGAGNTALLNERQGQQAVERQKMVADLEVKLQDVRGTQAKEISALEAQYRGLLQASSSAGSFFSTVSNDISGVLSNADIPIEAKQQLINQQVQLLQSGLAVIGGIAGIDLTDLLVFE